MLPAILQGQVDTQAWHLGLEPGIQMFTRQTLCTIIGEINMFYLEGCRAEYGTPRGNVSRESFVHQLGWTRDWAAGRILSVGFHAHAHMIYTGLREFQENDTSQQLHQSY